MTASSSSGACGCIFFVFLVHIFVQKSLVFQVSGSVGDEAGVVGVVVDVLDAVYCQLLFLAGELVPFAAATGDVDFRLPHHGVVFVPETVEVCGDFFLSGVFGFRRDTSGPKIKVGDTDMEYLFLMRDEVYNASFGQSLKETGGFGACPAENIAPVVIADKGVTAFA